MEYQTEESLGLLEYLSVNAGCMYLSDLPQEKYRLIIEHTLWGLSCERFSLREWNDAVTYITGQEHVFVTKEQAWQFLLCGIDLERKAT